MNSDFKDDYYRMTGKKYRFGITFLFIMVYSHQIRYMYWWRKAHNKSTMIRKYILYKYSRKYGLEIGSGATIGHGLYLGHPYNITVSNGSKIGNNVNLHKGCTIGRENRGKRYGSPTIGNCVSVGINSTIVGKITIGDDVLIAPNSYVNFDVPSHSIVIGNPAVIHHRDNATEEYINFRIEG